MTEESSSGTETPLSSGEAFAAIGHETRVEILEALATADRADRPLSFSELRDRVGDVDSSRFNYHLDTLAGHFLERSDEGYDFRSAGERVAEAILSGAVSDDVAVERTEIDETCQYCGAPIELEYHEERLWTYCTECSGTYGSSNPQEAGETDVPAEYGFLGLLHLPSAGVRDRTPGEIHNAAVAWQLAEQLRSAGGICPRCSAPMEEWLTLCEAHDAEHSLCEECGNQYAALHSASCTNCVHSRRVLFGAALLDSTALQSFLTDHGMNLVAPDYDRYASVVMDYEETIHGTDPFEAEFTFTADGDVITLHVDDALDVVNVTRRAAEN
jgi:DNA-binding transcriptional ArsR family regulator